MSDQDEEPNTNFVQFTDAEIELRTNDEISHPLQPNEEDEEPIASNFGLMKRNNSKLIQRASAAMKIIRPELPKTEEERLKIGPLTLLFSYRRIPVKLLFDVMIAVFLFVLVSIFALINFKAYLITNNQKHFIAANNIGFVKHFLPEGYEDGAENSMGYHTFYISNTTECVELLGNTIAKIIGMDAKSSLTYTIDPNVNLTMSTHFYRTSPRLFLANITNDYYLADNIDRDQIYFLEGREYDTEVITAANPLGKYFSRTGNALREVFDRLVRFDLNFALRSMDLTFEEAPECVTWFINIVFDNGYRDGRLKMSVVTSYGYCSAGGAATEIVGSSASYLALTVVILSFISLIVRVVYLTSRFRFLFVKRFRDQVSFFQIVRAYVDIWLVCAFVKDVLIVIGYSMYLDKSSNMENTDIATSFFTGVGSLLAYVGLIGHLRYYAKFYTLIQAVRTAIPNITRFVVGIFPIYIGYALAGTLWFGHYAPFYSSVDDTMVSLFALLHGDMMRENFDMLHGSSPFIRNLSKFFMFTYVLIFICGILNIFLTIMEDSYGTLMEEILEKGGEDKAIIHAIEEETRKEDNPLDHALKDKLVINSPITVADLRIDARIHLIDLLCESLAERVRDGDTRATEEMVEELRQAANQLLISIMGEE